MRAQHGRVQGLHTFRRLVVARGERLLGTAASLTQMAAQVPEARKRTHQSELVGPAARLPQGIDGQTEVLELWIEPFEPGRLLGARPEMGLGFLRQAQEIVGVPLPEPLTVPLGVESLGGVLADRLQHPEALRRVPNQALVDERLQAVEARVDDLLGRLQGAAAAEDREPSEEGLLVVRQQVVRPLDRRPQRPLALGCVAGAAGQKRQAPLEPVADLRRREGLHACRRKLERERQVVQAPADLRDRTVGLEVRLDRLCPREEEVDALLGGERGHRVLLLTCDMKGLAAGHEQVEPRAGAEQTGDVGRRFGQVLEVVEEQQHRVVPDVLAQLSPRSDRLPRRLQHELRVAQRSERNPEDARGVAVGRLRDCLQREPRLAGAAGPGQREQADVGSRDELLHLVQLPLAAEEGRGGHGQVRALERAQRREVARRRAGRPAPERRGP